jgi:FMNH2-dependent dimethyl sulfone monooxygenase
MGNIEGTWEETRRLAVIADRLDLEAVIPIARWRGYGGEHDFGERSFETFTWATGLLAATQRIQVFATCHVPIVHPVTGRKDGRPPPTTSQAGASASTSSPAGTRRSSACSA